MTTVIDASYAVDLLFNPERSALHQANEGAASAGLIAPVIFWHEVANALRNRTLRGLITVDLRQAGVRRLRRLGIEMDETPSPIEQVVAVSDRFQLTVYDAAYLELAMRTGSVLATRDKGLAAAATKAGVALAALV